VTQRSTTVPVPSWIEIAGNLALVALCIFLGLRGVVWGDQTSREVLSAVLATVGGALLGAAITLLKLRLASQDANETVNDVRETNPSLVTQASATVRTSWTEIVWRSALGALLIFIGITQVVWLDRTRSDVLGASLATVGGMNLGLALTLLRQRVTAPAFASAS
jgi:amino acid transporter